MAVKVSSHSVVVITLDFESGNPGSNPGGSMAFRSFFSKQCRGSHLRWRSGFFLQLRG